MANDKIQIEVAYATPHRQLIIPLRVTAGTPVSECISLSEISRYFPEIDLANQKVGIWSKTVKLEHEPREGDRIEIYRPLIADPKASRRRRAERAVDDGRADPVTGGRRRRDKTAEQPEDE
ncbi:RnfH family protein [Pseudidiomarina sp.]|uniref:RnfH family protein n=1 Tax=Pseudidiomarina sp. TaxID=2081707 RepID=UPI00299D89C6|nr:RnfH family protein [Pseudidiomarina sp.]MDX1706770.1 RnfH family protein [Pseudidiomarina sp.]